MVMESWGTNEYRTFITSRRDDVFESRDASSSAYAFKRAERDVFFDTDAKVPVMRTTLRNVADSSFKCAAPSGLDVDDDVFHPAMYRKQEPVTAATFVVSQRTVPEPFSQLSPHSLSRMYQPKYSKFCVNSTDVPPVETAMDSQSSSFRSQTSVSERDAGDSRDSTGSSNDASSVSTDTTFDRAFDAATTPTKPPTVVTPPPPPNAGSWTLKWKGIFGSRKPPKPPLATTTRPMSRLFNCDDKNNNLPEGKKKPKSFLAHPSDSSSVLSERDAGGILRIPERWMKYMRMLRPKPTATSKTMERESPVPSETTYVHTRAKSMPAILKTPPLRPRSYPVFQPSMQMPPAGPSSAAAKKKSTSFLAQSTMTSPRLMSLSPRVSRTSPKVSSSSPRMSSSSSVSSMSELHSAVQGAIAHCKQSHSGLLSPAPHRH